MSKRKVSLSKLRGYMAKDKATKEKQLLDSLQRADRKEIKARVCHLVKADPKYLTGDYNPSRFDSNGAKGTVTPVDRMRRKTVSLEKQGQLDKALIQNAKARIESGLAYTGVIEK